MPIVRFSQQISAEWSQTYDPGLGEKKTIYICSTVFNNANLRWFMFSLQGKGEDYCIYTGIEVRFF